MSDIALKFLVAEMIWLANGSSLTPGSNRPISPPPVAPASQTIAAPPALLTPGLAPRPAMQAQIIPVQPTSTRSQRPVLRLNGKASPVLDGSSVVTSGLGDRVDPFSGRTAFHTGIDLGGRFNAPAMRRHKQ